MTQKKYVVKKKDLPAKKTKQKDVAKLSTSNISEEQKNLKFSAEKKDGVLKCAFQICGEDGILALTRSTGCKGHEAAAAIIKNGLAAVKSGVDSPGAAELVVNNYLAMMAELKPKDAFEGMLISQMNIVYTQVMGAFSSARNNRESLSILERFQNQAIKLMRLYNQQLETLDKHRRGGNQKMIIEHVHVHPGGQAIVGTVTQGGGASNEK
jgi:hypothetical protein